MAFLTQERTTRTGLSLSVSTGPVVIWPIPMGTNGFVPLFSVAFKHM